MADTKESTFAGMGALVTGASSGIGLATAVALARPGADVAINYHATPGPAEKAAEQIRAMGRKALLVQTDVSDQAAVETMVAKAVQELGHVDLFVSSAVYSDREPFWTANMTGFRKTIEVSMFGAYYGLRAVTNHMLDRKIQGSIVIVSSPHAHIAFPNAMAYNMAKAALDQMARSAAMELLSHKIRVNSIHPGWTDTPGERKFFTEEQLAAASKQQPLGRLATSEEIARGILFLLDPAAGFITGTVLHVDGGLDLPFWSRRGSGDF